MQVPVPEHAPDQPEKVFPLLAEAVRVTDVPELKLAAQVEPQLIISSLLVTVPAPVSDVTVKLYAVVAKVAVTDVVAVIVTVQVPAPEQPPPDQPEKVDPLVAEATKVTDLPDA